MRVNIVHGVKVKEIRRAYNIVFDLSTSRMTPLKEIRRATSIN